MIKAKSEELQRAVRVLENVPVKPGIPSSEMIRLQRTKAGLKMSLASEVSGVAELKLDGNWNLKDSFFVDRKILSPFVLSASKKQEVSIVLASKGDTNVASIKIGRRSLKLVNGVITAGYIDVPTEKMRKIKFSPGTKKLIELARYFGSTGNELPQLECVYVSSDGYVMSSCDTLVFCGKDNAGFGDQLHIPLASVPMVCDSQIQGIFTTKQALIVDYGYGTLIQAFPSRIKKDFPAKRISKMVLDSNDPTVGVFDATKLVELFKRFNRYLASVSDKYVTFTGDKSDALVKIKAEAGTAIFTETVRKGVTVKKDFEFKLPLEGVAAFINHAAERSKPISVKVNEAMTSLISEDMTLLIARRK